MDFSQVIGQKQKPYFAVNHWFLEVPTQLYYDVLCNYDDPFIEEAVQEFVSNYLRWVGDDGFVGLVGIENKGDIILIDAAVRYSH